jgi:hypothetical protein
VPDPAPEGLKEEEAPPCNLWSHCEDIAIKGSEQSVPLDSVEYPLELVLLPAWVPVGMVCADTSVANSKLAEAAVAHLRAANRVASRRKYL